MPTTITLDPNAIQCPVPALRGSHVGDSQHPFTEEDIARLKHEVGMTAIRFGMEARSLADEKEVRYHESGFRYVNNVLDWCAKYGIQAVLDQHNALGRAYGGDPRLWREQYFQDRFVGIWEELARRFKDHPAVAAYEFINEPEPPLRDGQPDFAVWNNLYKRTLAAVRKIDPYKTVIIDCIGYANPRNFVGLELSGDPNTVYSFHNYQPGPYHAQKRREQKDQSTYYYPGFIPRRRPENPQDFSQVHVETTEGKFWNRAQLVEEFAPPLAFKKQHNVPLFCGEFGCVSDCPPMTDMVYLMDEIGIFHENGITWTLYNTMYRTSDDYWKTHFDCNLYIYHVPDQQLFRFDRKIALIEYFCRNEGDVLKVAQPDDEWVGLYAMRRRDRAVSALISNKHRQETKDVTLRMAGLPPTWPAAVHRMDLQSKGFDADTGRTLTNGELSLRLPPLTILQLTIAAPNSAAWRVDELK